MKIVSVDIIQLRRVNFSAQTPVLCRVNTDEGIYGYGEAGVSIMDYSIGAGDIIRILAKNIIGMNPLETDVIYEKLASSFWAQGNGGVVMAAISAIDIALWDIKGKYFNVPCYVLLGGKHRKKLRAYASQLQFGWKNPEFFHTPGSLEFIRHACKDAVEDGYDAIKVDLISKKLDGSTATRDELQNHLSLQTLNEIDHKLAVCRDEVGTNVDIIIENHNGTTANTALQIAKIAEPYNVMFLEEPATPLNPMEYKRIAAGTSIPLATGERTYRRDGFLPLLQTGALSVIQPDLGNCGGFTEGRKICDMAQSFGVTVQTHTCNSPISVAAALQFEATIPNFIIHEHHTANTIEEVTNSCIHNYQPVNGYFEIPDLPGIGNEPTQEALAKSVISTIR